MNRDLVELSTMHVPSTRSSPSPTTGATTTATAPHGSTNSALPTGLPASLRQRLALAFLALGLFNNSIYVIILSAALDLAADVPKGVILFCNIAPALIAKVGWPYLLRGRVRYSKRILSCTVLFISGVLVVAQAGSLTMRLVGISMASFASGLGEMTCLQLASTLGEDEVANYAVGWFSSGTGAAGFVGAGLWWVLRGLGVRLGLSLTSLIPIGYSVAYFFILPQQQHLSQEGKAAEYTPVASSEDDEDAVDALAANGHASNEPAFLANPLSLAEKMSIARPLLLRYMAPLFLVYLAEYTINQGISPDLLYPVAMADNHFIFKHLVTKLSDYYPLWQLVYQTLVFVARSSTVLLGMPVLPRRLLYLPSVLQLCVLLVLALEAGHGLLENFAGGQTLLLVLLLIANEGLLGGYAYVSTFSRLSSGDEETAESLTPSQLLARKEFRMGCVGFADTLGILTASLVSMWLEPKLCSVQVDRGKWLCRQVQE